MIAASAYFIAEQRGFTPGYEECDWLTAEAEINAFIKQRYYHPKIILTPTVGNRLSL
jgi:hypothetical protein